jgi:hypothetical protein
VKPPAITSKYITAGQPFPAPAIRPPSAPAVADGRLAGGWLVRGDLSRAQGEEKR